MTPRTAANNHSLTDPRPRSAALTLAAVAAAIELVRPRCDDRKAVAWLSAYCAALERVVYPAARRRLPARADAVTAAAVTTRSLEQELQHLHQKINGDGRAMSTPLPAVRGRVRDSLETQLLAHEQLLDELRDACPADEWSLLLDRHRQALRQGPTRPHPHAPHSGLAERAAFRLAAAADRIMNILDSQSPPRPPVLCSLSDLPERSREVLERAAGPAAAAGS